MGQAQTTLLIDALDEARLRVTQGSFEDFLGDVEALTRARAVPAILFGRVAIVEEAWLILSDRGLHCPVFDIDLFDGVRARRFVMATLDRLSKTAANHSLTNRLDAHRGVYKRLPLSSSPGWSKRPRRTVPILPAMHRYWRRSRPCWLEYPTRAV